MATNEGAISNVTTNQERQPIWRYDVFLSFEERDTRSSFAGNLYHALHRDGNKVFMDLWREKLCEEEMMALILEAIEESRMSIVVLSENYVSSPFCLEILTKILDCNKRNNLPVFPIFCGVDPSDIRHQRGCYGDAMTALKKRYGKEGERWSSALREVAKLSGYSILTLRDTHEYDYIESIMKLVSNNLPCYDVFLSVNEKDTHCSFTDFLYKSLDINRFKIFINDKGLEDGDQSSVSDLVTAIEKSRLSIIVFSENYVSSSSCLEELDIILNCMKTNRQQVWPIFYKVESSEVRHQTSSSFVKAMMEHESKFGHDKAQKWKLAMFEAATLKKEWHAKIGDEYDIIEEILELAIEI